jgi:hypothetical protein
VLPARWASFYVLIFSSFCARQKVSARCSLAFIRCPHLSHPLCLTASECPPRLTHWPSFGVLTCLPLCTRQSVSALRSLSFFQFGVLTCTSLRARQLVSVCRSLASFWILTCPSLCAEQEVSACPWLALIHYPHVSLPLRSTGSECSSLAGFFAVLIYPPLCHRQYASVSLAGLHSVS